MRLVIFLIFCSLAFVSAEEFNYSQYESIKPEDFKKVISENTKKGNGPTLYQKKTLKCLYLSGLIAKVNNG
jgi:hypothetical protein